MRKRDLSGYDVSDGDESSRIIKQYIDTVYRENASEAQSYWAEADIDARFRAGDQSGRMWSGSNALGDGLVLNHIARNCDLISGYQRRNRKSLIVTPVSDSLSGTSDDLSKTLFSTLRLGYASQHLSSAFDSCITTGLSFISIWIDFRDDPISGDIKFKTNTYSSFLFDMSTRKLDLSDCEFFYRRTMLSKQEVQSLLPGKEDEIDKIPNNYENDGKFSGTSYCSPFNNKNRLPYDEFWYKSHRKQTLLMDVQNGKCIKWHGSEANLKRYLKDYPEIARYDTTIPTTKLVILVSGRVMYHGENALGIDRYPLVPVIAYHYPEVNEFMWVCQGVVRRLRHPQSLFNHQKMTEADILNSNATSGYLYHPAHLVDIDDVFQTGQGKGIAVKPEFPLNEAAQKIQPPTIPASMSEFSKNLSDEMQQISGINEELAGSAVDDKAGVLSVLRQGAGLTTLQSLFDNLDSSYRLLGDITLELIQKNFSPDKVSQIIGHDPKPEFYSRDFCKYEVTVEEGNDSSTQKAIEFQQLMALQQAGINVPKKSFLNATTIQNRDELMRNVEEQEKQASEMQDLEIKLKLSEQRANIKDIEARAEANRGLGLERASRVQENRAFAVERLAEAEKEHATAVLDRAKTMTEIQDLKLNQVEKLLGIYNAIKQEGKAETSKNRKEIYTPSQEEIAVIQKGESQGNPITTPQTPVQEPVVPQSQPEGQVANN